MYFSSVKFHKYRSNQRNIQTPLNKLYRKKAFSAKAIQKIKHSNSCKILSKFDNSNKKIFEKNSIELKKPNLFGTLNSKCNMNNMPLNKGFFHLFDNNKVYSSIISKIEHLKNLNKYNKMKLYYILIKIEKFINNFFNSNDSDNENNSIKNNNILIEENLNKENHEIEINTLRKKINKLEQKLVEAENKFKIERLNYLFYIGEYQNKISDLNKIINTQKIEKIPKSELNKIICFPQYPKFYETDEINPKSIPMYLSAQNNKAISPRFLQKDETHKSHNKPDFNRLFQKDLIKFNHSLSSSSDNINIKEDNNKNDYIYNEEESECQKLLEKGNNMNETIKLGQKYFNDKIISATNIFKNNKNYFLAHPKLKYIKDINSKNNIVRFKYGNQINSLPKQISKLTTISKSQKNSFISFPSFLNETLHKIEKLRTYKNFRNIDNNFKNLH